MLRVGLTGGIGSGKSTVSARLAELGAVILDADQAARAVVEPGTPGLAAIAATFGDGVLAADGSLTGPSWPGSCSRTRPRSGGSTRSPTR